MTSFNMEIFMCMSKTASSITNFTVIKIIKQSYIFGKVQNTKHTFFSTTPHEN